MRKAIYITWAWGGSGYLPETTAFISAENAAWASFTTPQSNAIDRWFRDMMWQANGSYSTFNVYSRLKIVYLSLNGSYAPDRVNAVSPWTLNYTDTGSPTYSAVTRSVAYNGTWSPAQYSDTWFTPNGSVTFWASDFTGFWYHRVDTHNDTNATMGEVGWWNSYMQLTSTGKTVVSGARTAFNASNANPVNGLWFTSRSNSTTLNTYANGSNIAAVTTTFNNTPLRSIYLGAYHSSSPGYGGPCTIDFHIEVTGAWSNGEAQMIYNATKALKAVFGITWL